MRLRSRTSILRRLAGAATLCTGVIATAGLGFAPAAHADDSSSATEISGYTATIQALGVQYAFDIPGMFPLPNQNLMEEDVPFARTSVQQGPVVNSIGTPYYPGDILGHFGSLLAEFAPQLGQIPGAGSVVYANEPLLAEADYPPAPGYGADESFGGTPPAGVPIAPNVASGTAHANAEGGSATATVTDLQSSPPSSTNSSLAHMGPAALGDVSLLGDSSSPMLDVGSIQSTNSVSIGQSQISGTATDVLKTIDIAGVLDISQITSNAGSVSDGNTGTPTAALHMAGVTVDGQPAYIDNQGVHVSGTSTTSTGVTPQQAQSALNTTFAQDGISVRLLDPATNTKGAEGTADSGGLVVSFVHQFDVPYIPGEPTIPICVPPASSAGLGCAAGAPGLGNQALPAGTYTATTSMTLGSATSDVQAAVAPVSSSDSASGLSGLGGDAGLGLGVGNLGTDLGIPSSSFGSFPGSSSGPTTGASGIGPEALGARTASRFPLGIPAPLGWLVVLLLLCVIMAYPMLLAARWQFLSGRGR